MYSIFFYYSFWIKVRQSFLCLFLRSNTMLNSSKSSICWSNVDCLLQNFAILWHGSISTIFQSSFIESLATEFELVTFSIVATIGFATQAQHFWTSKLFFKKSRLSLIMFLVSITASSGENVSVAFAVKLSVQSRERNWYHSARFSVRITSSKFSSDEAK